MEWSEAARAVDEEWRVTNTVGEIGTIYARLGLDKVRVLWDRDDMPPYKGIADLNELTRVTENVVVDTAQDILRAERLQRDFRRKTSD